MGTLLEISSQKTLQKLKENHGTKMMKFHGGKGNKWPSQTPNHHPLARHSRGSAGHGAEYLSSPDAPCMEYLVEKRIPHEVQTPNFAHW